LDKVHLFLLIGTVPTFSMPLPTRGGKSVLLGLFLDRDPATS
jgi:hypothetical protein